jgi:hypothetical protein
MVLESHIRKKVSSHFNDVPTDHKLWTLSLAIEQVDLVYLELRAMGKFVNVQ